MKLPLPDLKRKKKDQSEYYLALLLRDEKAVAVVLEAVEGKIQVIGRHEQSFTSSLEEVSYEELLETLDKTISRAEEKLPPNIETEKTVFGIKESWIEEKKIKKDYLIKLKKLCDELSLSPIGFMVISEAIANLLQKEEGAPLSGVLAEIGKTQVTLSLFRAGKPIEVHSAKIEDSIAKTVDKLLHHFTTDVLPSRIIIFHDDKDEELAQEFIHHHWSKSLPFLHVPQVSVLPSGFDGQAMVYGAADQMGFEILGDLGDTTVRDLTGKETASLEEVATKEEEVEEKDKTEETADDKTAADEDAAPEENFGFVVGKEVPTLSSKPVKEPLSNRETEKMTPEKEPGFIVNRPSDNLQSPDEEEEPTPRSRREEAGGMFSALGGVTSIFSGLFSRLSLKSLPSLFSVMKTNRLLLFIPVIIILLIGLLFLYLFKMSATVTLAIEPKRIAETQEVNLNTDSSNNFAESVLAAKEVDVSLEGSTTTNATGKKEVGEKAKGTVTLYNSADVKKTLPSGTVLTSSNNLEFVTTKEVIIASASGDIFSGIESGTAKVEVSAKEIGNEYNLPSNATFKVTGSSTVAAKNESAFSGGSKKEVTVVSKKDLDKLSEELPKSLKDDALNAVKNKISDDESSLSEFTQVTLSKKSYDKKEDQEAKTVTLKATVVFTTLSYDNKDVEEFAESSLKDKYTQDLAISDKGVSAQLQDIDINEDGEVTAVLVMSAGLLPKLNETLVVSDLKGKSISDATVYLEKLPQVRNAEITFSPNIPLFPKMLPRSEKNITLKLTANE